MDSADRRDRRSRAAGGGAAIAAVVASRPPAHRHDRALPAKLLTVQTTGLVNSGAPGATTRPLMLLDSAGGLSFALIPAAELAAGDPQWTADLLAGGTYIFIYAPTGQCLDAAGSPDAPVPAARRCDLGRSQRWEADDAGIQGGHYDDRFRNLASGRCLSAGESSPAAAHGAATAVLAPCAATEQEAQLISFWWTS
ncbi:MAG: RICIN domain-containing protein [Streptosporangiaceae bacterium]|jgi:hypothetical protein